MNVQINDIELEEAVEDYFSKKGIRIVKDTIVFDVSDFTLQGVTATLESTFN